jgi:hypothetical protein
MLGLLNGLNHSNDNLSNVFPSLSQIGKETHNQGTLPHNFWKKTGQVGQN